MRPVPELVGDEHDDVGVSLAGVAEEDDVAHQHGEAGQAEEGLPPIAAVGCTSGGEQGEDADLHPHPYGQQPEGGAGRRHSSRCGYPWCSASAVIHCP